MSLQSDTIPPPPQGTSQPPRAATNAAKVAPPEWPIEKFCLALGKPAAAAKNFLDRLAKIPPLKPIMAFFSSVWVGIVLLFLIGLYVGIGSGFASLRASLEMTDLQFFDAWPMQLLIALLAITLTTVTLRRIPFTLYKAGVWTVHIGILTFLTGAVIYFSMKTEGSVRIFLNQSVDYCYDTNQRSLYAFNINPDGSVAYPPTMTPLPTLPIYYEHLPENNRPLDIQLPTDTLGKLNPALKDASLKIVGYYPAAVLQPTGWRAAKPGEQGQAAAIAFVFQSGTATSPEQVLVNATPAGRILRTPAMPWEIEYLYHPTPQRIRDLQASFAGSSGITVRIPKLHIERTYPAVSGKAIEIEGSPYTLTPGEIMNMPLISKGYENTTSSALWVHVVRKAPLDSVSLPAVRGPLEYDRLAVFRYPERTPDFINEDGKQVRKQDGVDPDIQIVFHDASRPQLWIIEDDNGKLSSIIRTTDGTSVTRPFTADNTAVLAENGAPPVTLRITQHTENAVQMLVPAIIPPEFRPRAQTPADAMQHSFIEMTLQRGNLQVDHIYVPFVQFAQVGEPPMGQPPAIVDIPNVGKVGLLLSTTRRELPVSVKLTDFKAVKYPGAVNAYQDYISTLDVTDKKTGATESLVAQLNEPAASHGLCFFQAFWDGHENAAPGERWSILGVGNRPGLTTMTVGVLLVIIGIGYAFYIKPMLLNAKKRALAAWNAARMTDLPKKIKPIA